MPALKLSAASRSPVTQPSVRSTRVASVAASGWVPERLPHEGGDLLRGEAQLLTAELAQLPACAERVQRDRGVLACAEDEVQGPGRMVEEFAQQGVDGRLAHQVIVVQHEDEAPSCGQIPARRPGDRGHWSGR